MIEVIYKEETAEQDGVQGTFSMPRNVRQIGLANGNYRIYVEDYVYTFLKRLSEEEKEQGKAAVLTGEPTSRPCGQSWPRLSGCRWMP